jgi:uncharacterized protein (DUF488 family)
MSGGAPDIFTIGYEGLVQDQLLDLVQAAGVDVLLDVRAVAASRKAGFSKNLLRGSLEARGIDYVHDVRLGTPKAGRQAARSGRVSEMAAIFDAHMGTAAAQAGFEAAIALAARRRVCLLCFERDAHDCHRGILAALIRRRTGQAIRHL